MYVGFSVNEVHEDLASIWWRPGKGLHNVTEWDKARAIFYDIAEAMHQQPNLGEGWREAWEESASELSTRQAAAAAGSSRPSTRHPASGGERSRSPLAPKVKVYFRPGLTADGTSPQDALSRASSAGSSEDERGTGSNNAAALPTDWQRGDKSPARRSRRRSRSKSVDVTLIRHSRWGFAKLPVGVNEELRQVLRREDIQQKFSGFQWHPAGKDPASGGQRRSISQRHITDVWRQLPSFAQPMPSWHDFVLGIPHHSDEESEKDKLWPVVTAIASTKMYYLTKLCEDSDSGEWLFDMMWPDPSPDSGGNHPLSEECLERLYLEGYIQDKPDIS